MGSLEASIVLGVAYLLGYLPLLGWVYGRRRRWHGLAGWALLVGGLLLAFGGAGNAFAWASLLWIFLAAFGVLLILMDLYHQRRATGDR